MFLFTLYMTLNMCAYAYFQGRLAETVSKFATSKRKSPMTVENELMDEIYSYFIDHNKNKTLPSMLTINEIT